MNLQMIKKHVRVDHSFEDDLLEQYIEWAESEVKDSVTTSETRNDAYFVDNPHYERAVTMLVGHFFENRLPFTDIQNNNVPYGVMSAIHKMRGAYHEGE